MILKRQSVLHGLEDVFHNNFSGWILYYTWRRWIDTRQSAQIHDIVYPELFWTPYHNNHKDTLYPHDPSCATWNCNHYCTPSCKCYRNESISLRGVECAYRIHVWYWMFCYIHYTSIFSVLYPSRSASEIYSAVYPPPPPFWTKYVKWR